MLQEIQIVSADQSANALPAHVKYMHPTAFGAGGFQIEVMGLKRQIFPYIQSAKVCGVEISSIHGPIESGRIWDSKRSVYDNLKLFFANKFYFASLEELLPYATDYAIVTHAPYTKDPYIKRKIVEYNLFQNPIKCWWVENHDPGIKGIQDAAEEVISLRRFGVNAKLLFDGCHFVGQEVLLKGGEKLKNAFSQMLDVIERPGNLYKRYDEAGREIEVGSHFAAGLSHSLYEKCDVFPVDQMEISQLKRFVDLLDENEVRWRVWEHQIGGIYPKMVLDTEWMEKARKTNGIVFQRLEEIGYFKIPKETTAADPQQIVPQPLPIS